MQHIKTTMLSPPKCTLQEGKRPAKRQRRQEQLYGHTSRTQSGLSDVVTESVTLVDSVAILTGESRTRFARSYRGEGAQSVSGLPASGIIQILKLTIFTCNQAVSFGLDLLQKLLVHSFELAVERIHNADWLVRSPFIPQVFGVVQQPFPAIVFHGRE